MALTERKTAARKAAAVVAVMKRPPERRRDGPRARTDLHDAAVRVVSHHHPTRVARQALGRFRGNARAVLEDRLARRIGVGQHRRIDMHDHLVPLARRAGIDPVMERRLSEQRQCVGLLLGHRGRFRGNVKCRHFRGNVAEAGVLLARSLIQRL